ncbi:putative F-box/LRR-repeat protein At3g18150 [Mercurialis annua]|uniref:putative F-box/LRR-repeat protein At3g18150 n=1 Tax=Mercurialis annua TaxID=3986 RepID=UPI002160FA8F|nr:putative F-box/LRR-repeat protein At3g18150 [Mercurialis annua]
MGFSSTSSLFSINHIMCKDLSSKLHIFSIEININELHKLYPSIESWLQLAVGRAVESLTLDFPDGFDSLLNRGSAERISCYLLPQFIYSNSHIRILTTTLCEFVPHGRISWSTLKELSIQRATLNDEVIQNILNGTPLLENLQMIFCYGFKLLDLSLKPKLKTLVINVNEFVYGGSDDDFELKIVGPYVETLKISGSWENFKCKLMNMSSLVKAALDFELMDDGEDSREKYQNMGKELIENVIPAQQLQLTKFSTQILSTLRMDVMAPLSLNLKSLHVEFRGEKYLPGIERVLQCSHKLEKLIIFFDYTYGRRSSMFPSPFPCNLDHGKDWTTAEIPSCLDSHLTTIVISGVLKSRVVLEFLQFLLMNSNILEKMILSGFHHQKALKWAEKLSRFPRSSQQAVFLVAPK